MSNTASWQRTAVLDSRDRRCRHCSSIVGAEGGSAKRTPSGSGGQQASGPQLVSIEPLPEVGPTCELEPAGIGRAAQFFFPHVSAAPAGAGPAALQQGQGSTASGGAVPDDATRLAASQRTPVRVIRDPYPSFSSVAVDPIRDEVVLTDDNLFQILVYDRLANTPPTAALTEPKRVLGGLRTKIEFQAGLYVDPANGDIYAVNNDTVNTLVIFSEQKAGNVPPDREFYTPHGTYGIAVDEGAQELYLTSQHDSAIVVFRKTAQKEESPVRLLQGDRTGLATPHGTRSRYSTPPDVYSQPRKRQPEAPRRKTSSHGRLFGPAGRATRKAELAGKGTHSRLREELASFHHHPFHGCPGRHSTVARDRRTGHAIELAGGGIF